MAIKWTAINIMTNMSKHMCTCSAVKFLSHVHDRKISKFLFLFNNFFVQPSALKYTKPLHAVGAGGTHIY